MSKNKELKIIGLTTDPYGNIYGYSLVFFRLFDYLQRTNKHSEVILISNNGISSTIVKNPNFKTIHINRTTNSFLKTIILVYTFVKLVFQYDKNTVILANCEIPELIAALILKIKFKKVYGVIQDDRVRNNNLYTQFVCKLRVLLLYTIKDIIFTNRYTMTRFNKTVNKRYHIKNGLFYKLFSF